MEDLNGPWLFDSMYTDDPEAGKLAALPGMGELLAAYPYEQANRKNCSQSNRKCSYSFYKFIYVN